MLLLNCWKNYTKASNYANVVLCIDNAVVFFEIIVL